MTANYDISYIDGTLKSQQPPEKTWTSPTSGVYDGDAHSITVNNEITGTRTTQPPIME